MIIEKTLNGANVTMKISGRLDTTTAPELENAIGDLTGDVNSLVLDFAALEYVSSAGLRVILKAQKMLGARGGMKLINVNATIMEVFDITGFTDILTIE